MIPIKDDNPTQRIPLLTVGLILANLLVFFYEMSLGPGIGRFLELYGAIPHRLFHGASFPGDQQLPPAATVMTSMFLHGGLMHLGGNMLYLWIFGNNIEDRLGHLRFLLFYILCGYVGAYAHALTDPQSAVPMVGASGAISGILGAYLLLFPRAKVLTLIPVGFFIHLAYLPAVVLLGFWFMVQFFLGTLSLGKLAGGVAWFAHIGGFLAGITLVLMLCPPVRRRHRE